MGDIVFFKGEASGLNYVIHRIVKIIDENKLQTCGDGNWIPDPVIDREEVIAKAVAVDRGKWHIDLTKKSWIIFGRFWMIIRPVRKPIIRLIFKVGIVRHKLFK